MMTFRSLAFLLLVVASAFPQRAAPVSLREIERRIAKERAQPASTRLRTLELLSRHRTQPARKLLLSLWKRESESSVRVALLRLMSRHEHADVLRLMRTTFKKSDDEALLRQAAYGLARQGSGGIDTLARALGDGDERRREQALYGLSIARDDPKATAALERALDRAKAPWLMRVLTTLRHRRPKSAGLQRKLVKLLASEDLATRTEALRQLALVGHRSVKKAALEVAAEPDLERKYGPRGAVLYALGSVLDAKTLAVFLRLARQDEAQAEREMRSLAKDPDRADAVGAQLARRLPELVDAADRRLAVRLVAEFPKGAAAVVARLRDEDPSVALAAIGAAVRAKVPNLDRHLGPFLQSDRIELRTEALLVLHENLKARRSWPRTLMKQLDVTDVGLRTTVLDLLADLSHRSALPKAQALMEAPEWPLRSAAYGFVRRVRDTSSIPLLITRLANETGRLEAEVLSALRALTGKDYPKAEYWEGWWKAVAKRFELPPAPSERKGRKAKPAGAVTFYRIPLVSKRAAFLLDVSGSMKTPVGTKSEPKIAYAKRALISVIDKCADDQHFNLIRFAGRPRPWAKELRPASVENREKAKAFVKKLRAGGGTNVHDSLELAFADEEVDTIYLVSDGAPSAGAITNIQRLADEVRRWNRSRRIVIHTVAIGHESPLLERLATESGGTYIRWI